METEKQKATSFRVKVTPEGCYRLTVRGPYNQILSRAYWPSFTAALDFFNEHFELVTV
jgi:hypothetical protein